MAKRSNADEVARWLESFILGFDFTLPGADQNLGRDLARAGAGYLTDRSIIERRGASRKWDPNEEAYRRRKEEAYGWGEANDRTGQMLSEASMFGKTEVLARQILMKYGTGLAPKRTYSPADNRSPSERKADESTTDVEKAFHAHESHDRPFYEADAEMERVLIEVADAALAEYILRHN